MSVFRDMFCGWRIGRPHSLLMLLLAFGVGPLGAQQATTIPASKPEAVPKIELTIEEIEGRLKQLEPDTSLDDTAKVAVTDLYKQAIEQLKAADRWDTEKNLLLKNLEDAPKELASIKAKLSLPTGEPQIDVPSEAELSQLEQSLAKAQTELGEAQKQLESLESEPKRRTERRNAIVQLTATAKAALQGIDKDLAAAPSGDEPVALALARRTLLLARQTSLKNELAAYEQELATYDGTVELVTARRDLAARQVTQLEKTQKTWQQLVNARRRQKAEDQAREAAQARASTHSAVRKVAEENAEYASQRTDLTSKMENTSRMSEATRVCLSRLRDDFNAIQQKVEKASYTRTIGLLLRRQRDSLPRTRERRRIIRKIQSDASNAEIQLIDLERERRPLRDNMDLVVQQELRQLAPSYDVQERDQVRSELRELLEKRRDYLQALVDDYAAYLSRLNDWETNESELVTLTEQYAGFIDEHILWTRSNPRLGVSDLADARDAWVWLASVSQWSGVGKALWNETLRRPLLVIPLPLAMIVLLLARRRIVSRIKQLGQKASQRHCVSLGPTAATVLLTTLLVIPLPVLLWVLAWCLHTSVAESDFARAAAAGLRFAAVFLLITASIRQICRPHGLAKHHLDWSDPMRRVLRRNLAWLIALGLPLTFVFGTLQWQGNPDWQDSLGRLAYIALMLSMSVFVRQVLRPKAGISRQPLIRHRQPWPSRFWSICYPLAAGLPLVLAGLAAAGYYYSAIHMSRELRDFALLILAILLIYSVILRWILLAHRRLAMEQARRKRAAAQKAAETTSDDSPLPYTPVAEAEPEIDVAAISGQTTKLFRGVLIVIFIIGISLLGYDMLPAFGILKSIHLWPNAPVTLADLAKAILVVVMTILLSRNLPGFLEITFLERLPLDSGGRYAITAITRYVLVVVGVVVTSAIVGLSWSNVQWLVAAITVGLGFGLQEIFANFVSGLIILLERPVRVGDTVTVGDISGTVTRIRIRATTITDWDRKELIIPNKEFVTGQVVNWTLSDSTLRVIIPVGIAYGSDTELAEKLLFKVASEEPTVLKEPEPQVLFMGFGDSSLNFELRVFVSRIGDFLTARHALHKAIDREFRQAGVEIAFPQRDIHVRSVKNWSPPQGPAESQ